MKTFYGRSAISFFTPLCSLRNQLLAAGIYLSASISAHAATQTWNPGGAGGGNGTWDSGNTPDWDSGVAWTNGNDAVFSGTGGTITVVNPTADSLTFSASGPYVLQGGALTLTGSEEIVVNSDATIASTLGGGGLLQYGTGTLRLTGQDNFGGGTVKVEAGTLAVGGTLSDANGIVGGSVSSTGSATVSGATWLNNGNLIVGGSGVGSLTINSGGMVSDSNGYLSIGDSAGGQGSVTLSDNGSSLTVPGGQTLYVGNSGTGHLSVLNGASFSAPLMDLGENQGANGTVSVSGSGSSLTAAGLMIVGYSGTGSMMVSNGGQAQFGSVGTLELGREAGSSGTVTVSGSGSTLVCSYSIIDGLYGSGTMTISDGATVKAGEFNVGVYGGSSSSLTVTGSGSTLSAAPSEEFDLFIGGADFSEASGTGTLTISNGAQVTDWQGILGAYAGSLGTATVTGSGSSWLNSSQLAIGESGTGTLAISAGGGVSDVTGIIGDQSGAVGIVTDSGSGSAWTNSGDLYIGNSGTGTLVVSNGATASNANGWIGNGAGSRGTATVSGSGSVWTNAGDLYVGNSGTGTLSITGMGLVTNSAYGFVGYNSGSRGTVTVSGSGSKWTSAYALFLGYSGSGTLLINSGGSVGTDDDIDIAYMPGSGGTATVTGTGSTLSCAANLYAGYGGDGSLTISSGGAVSAGLGRDVYIGAAAGSSGTVTVTGSGSTLNGARKLFIGQFGTGTLLITGGGAVSDLGDAYIGDQADSAGMATVSGNGSTWTSGTGIYIGESGTGTLTIQAGGKVSDSRGYIGDKASSTGIATVSGTGSMWTNSGDLYIGKSGTGTLVIGNGSLVTDNDGWVGNAAGSRGTVSVTNPGSQWINAGVLYIGEYGTGSLSISGGAMVSDTGDAFAILGDQAGSRGTAAVSGSGSTWTNAGDLYVGQSGTGTLTVSDGGSVSDEAGVIGAIVGARGAATVTGSGSTWTNTREIFVGESGTGTLTVSAGGAVSGLSNGYVGDGGTSKGTVTVTGSGSKLAIAQELFAGESGSGALTISNGGAVSDEVGYIGAFSGSKGTVTVTGSGSKWTNTSTLSIGLSGGGAGTLALTDGATVSVTGSTNIFSNGALQFDATSTFNTGSLYIDGGTLATLGADTFSKSATLGSGGVNINSAGYNSTFSGAFSGTGGIDKIGAGTLTLTGSNVLGANLTVEGAGGVQIASRGSVSDVTGAIGYGHGATVTVSGSGSKWISSKEAYIGYLGTGALAINGGGLVTDSYGHLGAQADTSGTATVSGSGSKWTSAKALSVGAYGSGILDITSGGVVSANTVNIGTQAGSSGGVTVSGSGSKLTSTGNLFVAYSGTGSLGVNGGATVQTGGNGYIGFAAGSSGTLTESGSGTKWNITNNLAVGYSGKGSATITGGAAISDVSGFITDGASATGSVTVSGSGSKWTNSKTLAIGTSGTGTLTLTGGALVSVTGTTTLSKTGSLELDANSTFSTGLLTVNGGTLETLGADTFSAPIYLGTGGMKINSDGFNSTVSSTINGIGYGLTKSGSGTIILTQASHYNGPTAVNAGTLALKNAGATTASLGNTAITVASGATFSATVAAGAADKTVGAGSGGAGTVGATLTLDPGSTFTLAGTAIGTFDLRQDASFSGAAFTIGGASGIKPSLIFDIGNGSTGTDLIDVTKDVDVLTTGGDISIDALAGDTGLTPGNYDLIAAAGGFSGSDGNGLSLSGTTLNVGGTTYDLSLDHSTEDDEILTVSAAPPVSGAIGQPAAFREDFKPATTLNAPLVGTTAVPEPGADASMLSAFGIAAAWLMRRRRKERASVVAPGL